jgi:hypothetical protein
MDWLAHENASNSPNDKKKLKTHISLDRLGANKVLTITNEYNANNLVCG